MHYYDQSNHIAEQFAFIRALNSRVANGSRIVVDHYMTGICKGLHSISHICGQTH